VTHNPDLANEYSSRIIKLLDGELTYDTNPYSKKEANKEVAKHKKKLEKLQNEVSFKKTEKKKSMSLFTALSLSFKNLLTKKGRTIMVALAGSIGIIGIALILAVSAGMTNYINTMQSESLSSYPITVSSIAVNMDEASNVLSGSEEENETSDDSIVVYDPASTLIKMGKFNYLGKHSNSKGEEINFVDYATNYYAQDNKKDLMNDVKVSYASTMHIMTETSLGGYLAINNTAEFSVLQGTTSSLFYEQLNNQDYVTSIYDVVAGEYPNDSGEVALVMDSSGRLSNLELMSLGIMPEIDQETGKYLPIEYEDIVNKKQYKLIYHNEYYDDATGNAKVDFSASTSDNFYINNAAKLAEMYNSVDTKTLTITCILRQKDNASAGIFSNGIMYTTALTEEYRANCMESNIVKSVKNTYLTSDKQLINGDQAFISPYNVMISELNNQAFAQYKNAFSFTTPNNIKDTLWDRFGIIISDEAVIDLYLQVYGASTVPTGIYFYASTFEAKDDLVNMVNTWNSLDGSYDIQITDSTAMLSSILGTLVNTISYILIAFAGISLVVSSIMIGIITYTSVIERTKEIGVLRSVGASKRDVSRVFNAETIIIGFMAGLIGVLISLLLTFPISALLKNLTGVAGLAVMEILPSILLVVISVVLTFIAGLIPARIASKKDPVLALRSE